MDESFQKLRADSELPLQAPDRGWIRAIREALGMSAAQLASRLGISRAAIYKLEEREAARKVTLNQLDRAAHAMDCDVFYTLVPRNSLEQSIRAQARKKAERALRKANISMGLEAEGVEDERFVAAVNSSSGYSEALTDRHLWEE